MSPDPLPTGERLAVIENMIVDLRRDMLNIQTATLAGGLRLNEHDRRFAFFQGAIAFMAFLVGGGAVTSIVIAMVALTVK